MVNTKKTIEIQNVITTIIGLIATFTTTFLISAKVNNEKYFKNSVVSDIEDKICSA